MTTDRDDEIFDHNLKTLLADADPAAPSPDARARMRGRVMARHARPASRRSPVALVGWGLMAAAAGAMVIANVGGGGKPAPTASTAPVAAGADTLRLADGSTAELGAGGSLVELGPRRVRVRGAVLLDVAPGAGPFEVETAQGQLRVLGTRFLVEAAADRTVTSVLRGVVALRSGGQEEVLRAGEQGEMRQGVRPTRGPAPRLSHLVSWVAERRRRDERPDGGPLRSGALIARNPQWQEQEYPLPLSALSVDVHLENQIARVALDQSFHNPQDQTLEGVYKFALPPGAAVSRLAMYVDGKLMESAVVERMAARRIYEDIVYQRRDPALLEQQGASKVSMRIFPLPPRQDKRVVLAYTQPLARTYDDVTLTVPLPELDQPVGELAMRVKVVGCAACEITSPSHKVTVSGSGGDAVVSYRAAQETLGDSLVLRVRQTAPPVTVASTIADAQRYVLVRARPTVATTAVGERPSRWVILDDTSASRGPTELRAQAELIDHLIDDIDERDQVMVVAFDATHRRFATWQDAMAIDRKALRAFLDRDAGLGETDLVEGLAGAVRLLDGQPGYVVYVGDGTATGERRTIDELRDAVAGKATFIGLGVGDGVDLTTLGALADATGGVAAAIDLGDDLAWRSLDLVASLYTTRITGLAATVDGVGAEAVALLRSRQVAAGEDVELVVRAPARDDVRTVTLRGQAGGQPWTQTIDVASAPRAPGDGGYLPRLWAQRRLEALMTAGDRALAPCVTTPCPSDEERAIAAYHTRKREMVALGTEHFLLSQHTSLIVLENDAMYAEYGVRKGTGETWAPLALPATIPTVAAPAVIAATASLLREPLAWNYADAFGAGFADELDATVALGQVGTIGRGSGTGFGWSGVGRGAGGGGMRRNTADTKASDVAGATGHLGKKGEAPKSDDASASVTTGADLGTANAAREQPAAKNAGPPADSNRDDNLNLHLADGDSAADRPASVTTAPTAPAAEPGPIAQQDPVGGAVVEARLAARARSATEATSASPWIAGEEEAERQQTRWHGGYGGGRLAPIALNYSGDWRLDDLTVWLPGLGRTDYDDAAARLGDPGAGSITPEATAIVDRARAALLPGHWRWDDAAEVTIDRGGRLSTRRTLDVGVDEIVTYDGASLATRYPELDLGAERRVGDAEPALLAVMAPLVPPRPAQLARYYRVVASGDRQLTLTPIRGGTALRMTLTADGVIGELVELTATPRVILTATRTGDGWSVVAHGRVHAVRYRADASAAVAAAPSASVVLELPLPSLAVAQQAAAAATAGSAAWRHLQHQRAAAALAVGNPVEVAQVARALATAGAASVGELALASGGARWLDAATARTLVGALTSPIAQHLRVASGDADLVKVAAADGPVGLMAAHRRVLMAIERNDKKGALAALKALGDRGRGDVVRAIAAVRVAQTFAWNDGDAVVAAVDAIASGPYRNLLRQEAAYFAGYRGGVGRAAERWIALMTDVDLAAVPPVVDHAAYGVVAGSARGQLGWTQALTAWRQRVLTSDRLDHVLAFVRAAAVLGGDDLEAGLARAAALAGDDTAVVASLYQTALSTGRVTSAQALLDRALARHPDEPALLRLASTGAERGGDARGAATYLTRALDGEIDRPVSLTQIRADYTRLIALHGQVARAAVAAERDAAVAAALAVGRQWRAMDPDNAARERVLAELLLAVGDADEAWRYLSSPIDRAPREGTSFVGAAEVLERAGRLEQALGLWRRAFAIDATNPTWLQRQAMTELALGRKDRARAVVQTILDRRWHVRWDNVRWWAQEARRSL